MNAKEFLKQRCGYTDRDIEYNPNITLKNALGFMTEFAKYSKGQTLPIDSVVSSAMYKATFSFKKSSPRGGTPYWTTEIVPLEAKNETELKEKIETYQENDHNSYHEHIKLTSIELM